jgi:hypothetical protein
MGKKKKPTSKHRRSLLVKPTVSITYPAKSTPPPNINLPDTARGTASAPVSDPITSMLYQTNDGPPKALMPASFANWTLPLVGGDWPTVGATYMLTVYAFNHAGPGFDFVRFIRKS